MGRSLLYSIAILVSIAPISFGEDHPNQHHHPFRTIQPNGTHITLTYQGDEDFHWYEDASGYTVVDVRGEFRYATLGQNGQLVATDFLVGDIHPATAGLLPHALPSSKTMARLREKSRERVASRGVPLNDRIPAGARLIEGCILVRQSSDAENPGGSGNGNVQGAVSMTSNFWTDGLVYYSFDPAVTSDQQSSMLEAMDSWEAVAGIQFIQRTNQANYIYIFNGTGNWSYVGMTGGRQDLSIYNWDYKYIMMHELAHALGVWHEQSRPDRDSYVQINTGNIQSGMESNFDIQSGAQTHGDYDFDSIMHYGQCAFANCTCSSACRTISCLAGYTEWQDTIGQKTHLSVGDAANMAFLYGSPGTSSGMAEMTNPSANGALITGGSITFTWTTGAMVQEYRLKVGSGNNLGDFYDVTNGATNAAVTGLPVEGGDVHVRLYSKINNVWSYRSYVYKTDLCAGFPDANDADADGVPDGCDACAGADDNIDADADSVPDACDACPGSDDLADLDGDGIPDGCDSCPVGANNVDTDGDGTPDGCDECPEIDDSVDSDGDGTTDCLDECPDDPDKSSFGICGCGTPDVDADGDGTPDCNDNCPFDPSKLEPGADGCNATVPITGGGVLGGSGPTSSITGGGFCGGGASAASTLMLALLFLPVRRRSSRSRC
ncbi:MAG: M12 family metallopeptidase [Planctomycetes bacterium]|nr:M12 family metallopeptidase [Planctomycetota bacterium]